jgi:cupin 2 domain-containing protein
MMKQGNIFANIPDQSGEELFETILEKPGTRLERIVSYGQATPEGQWYDQKHDEWVMLLSGSADLQLEGEVEPRHLRSGDYLLLPARCRHRVLRTDIEVKTVWLAIHISQRP